MFKAVSGLPRGFAALVVACLFCLPLIASADVFPQTGRDEASDIVAGQVLVRFRDNADTGAVSRILRTYPAQSEMGGLYRLAAPVGAETAVAAQLQADPAVEAASVNPVIAAPMRSRAAQSQKNASNGDAARTTARVNPADMVQPLPPSIASQSGGTTPNRIAHFWLSDRQGGVDPSTGADSLALVGMCNGPRFNAGRAIWANIDYENMDAQTLRVQVYSLGPFLDRTPQEQLGAGWSVSVAGYNRASNTIQNVTRLPVGCYQARLYSSLDNSSTPLASVYFQIVTTSPEMQSSASLLWHLDHTRADDGFDSSERWVDIKASGAWNVTTGAEMTIAVIGYGADINHPKLKNHIWTDKTDPTLHGWNFDTNTSNINDDYGEGTFLAGLIAAEPDGLTTNGGLGVNWGAKIMPLRITRPYDPAVWWGPEGMADASNIISAIRWAREKHADIIFVSLWFKLAANGGREQQFKQLLRQEIQLARQDGIVVVAPVGDVDPNVPGEQSGDDIYPASLPQVLTVSTTDQADGWQDSAYKNSEVDVAAPGRTYILGINNPNLPWLQPSDRVDPAWVYGDTEFSAALVTGVVGLIRSVNPNLSPDEIENLLRNNADKVDTANHSYDYPSTCRGWNEYLGCGRINAERTLWNTTHELHGAMSITPITTRTGGQQCVRLENERTGAVTWKVEVEATADQDWVTVSGPFSARSTDQLVDYGGALPSYAKVCVNLGNGAGQRPYGYYPVALKISSTMTNRNAPETVTLPVVYAPRLYSVYLPGVSIAAPTAGQ